MNPEPGEELLSAYLDDELSADERAAVEKHLAESAAYRQHYAALQEVRLKMKSLERQRLDHDLAPIVLERAQRDALATPKPAADSPSNVPSGLWEAWRAGRSWRMIFWPAAALAAALTIAIFTGRDVTDERQVARHAAEKPSANNAAVIQREPGRDFAPRALEKAEPQAGPSAVPSSRALSVRKRALPMDAEGARISAMPAQAAGKSTSADLIVCDVMPEFITDHKIESLLNAHKIDWQRGTAADERVDEQIKGEPGISVGERYRLEATPGELAQVLAALRENHQAVRNIEPRQTAEEPALAASKDVPKPADGAKANSPTRKSITIWLRPIAPDHERQPR